MDISINEEIDSVEEAIHSLCRSIDRKTKNKEIKEEYQTLCNQATNALKKMRSISETQEYLKSWRQVGR